LTDQLELEGKVQEATSQILADKKLIEAQMDRISNISEEKNRFFVNITHELRTPLTLITAPL
jgi:signal transduction histidine kinase